MTDLVSWSDPAAVELQAARYVAAAASAARAQNTSSSYESDWRQWMRYRAETGTPEPETAAATLVALGGFLEHRRPAATAATLKRNLAGIRRGMIDRGQPWPDSPLAAEALRNHLIDIARTQARGLRQASPVSEGLLRQAASAAPDTPKGRRDRAMLVVGFLSAMRRDNLCRLDLADVRFDGEGVALHQRRAKKDQGARGLRIFIPLTRHPETCATRTLQAWLRDRGDEPGPLFWSIRSHQRLDGSTIYRTIRALTEATGDPVRYSPHSLRSGLITAAAKRGASPHAIKQQSGHASIEMVERYTRTARGYEDNVVNLLESL